MKYKEVLAVGVRGKMGKKLLNISEKYIDFGKFYTGKRTYIESENPAEHGGTA